MALRVFDFLVCVLLGSLALSEAAVNYKPIIQNVDPVIEVSEDETVGSQIAVVRATDDDGDPITFSLDPSFKLLTINSSGSLILNEVLDRETKDDYNFKVFAADNYNGGGAARQVEKTFYLHVKDVNDNKPQFISSPYVGRVSENDTINHVVLTVSANDADSGANRQITYKFSNDTQTDKFAINNLNGQISIAASLDFETAQRYTLFVVAQDAGSPRLESHTTVIVDITDVSDNPPKFLKSTYLEEVPENTAIGTEIVRVEAVDGDTGVNNPLNFAVVSGNDHGIFKINATSGSITINGSIDAEKEDFYRITVRATEIPDPSFNTTVLVVITVVDRNDNPPQFPKESFHFSVREDVAKPGYIVTDQLNVRDGDKNPEFRQFEYFISGAEGSKFAVDNGILTINATLDYEQENNYTFKIFANETKTSEKLWGSAVVTVELVNVNDNNPMFEKQLYTFPLKEEVQAGVVVAQITASDADLGSFGKVTYELVGEGATLFAVVPSNGTIYTTGLLDYEKDPEYSFALLAKDGGGFYEKRNATTIKVILEDVNDNSPTFEGLPYSVNILESEKAGKSVFQVKASDKDSGDNGRMSYNITAGNDDGAFAINSSGLVWLTKELDREKVASYSLTIMSYDHGVPSRNTTTVLIVSVLDINDNKPVVQGAPYISTNMSENAGGGTVVYKLLASDEDAGNNKLLTYAITFGNEDGRFILNSGTGILQISPTGLDREVSSSYNLTVNVTDSGNPVQWQSLVLHVDVLDINDHAPKFNPPPLDVVYFISMSEGPDSLNKQVIDLNATDQDDRQNAAIRYSLSGDEHGFFQLNSSTGVLTVAKILDRENPNITQDARDRGVFSMDITATDQAEPSSDRRTGTVRVTVYVIDLNDNTPSFVDPPSSTHVSEAATPGTNIVQLSAIDTDSQFNGRVEFNITKGDPEGFFKITSNGNLLVEKTLDAEKVDVYNLTIEAKDKGSPPRSSTTLLKIHVHDVNDNDPKFNQSTYSATVVENANYTTSVVTVFAEDPDKDNNGEVLYKINSGDSTEAFTINNKTGLISVAGNLDREKTKEYTLTIEAEDQGHPSSRKDFATVVIKVLDVNDNAPRFTQNSYEAEIEEGSPAGKTVKPKETIRATDEDDGENAVISYSLSGPGSENFIINSTTGVIATSVNCSLDRERNSSYTIQLTATDGGGKSTTVNLLVTILDINDEAPRFSEAIFHANISESATRGTTVRRVTATDLDLGINKEITYTSTGADAKFYISRATGDIIVDATLDREFKSSYILNVTAANIGEHAPEGYCQVYITITDVIDDKPFFVTESTTVHISESASIGTNVTRVAASDKDIGDTLTYAVVGGNPLGQFAINATTGVITTAKNLDRENATEYILLVQASDSLNFTSDNLKLVVKIDDVNDNDPVFTEKSYVVAYREESHEDTSIIKVKAIDADFGVNAEVVYSIVENVTQYVVVDPSSGQVSQGVKKLDREQSPLFNFTVRATDKGSPPRTSEVKVSLELVDINDNAPEFNNTEYHASVSENLDPGAFVLVVTATDRDIGTNGKLEYGLQGGNFRFKINRTTGNITTDVKLNREELGAETYTLTVLARDEAIRSLQGTTRVIVTVTDNNDHTPEFAQAQYKFTVKENAGKDHVIGTVLATDRDKDRNAKISYVIDSGNTGDVLQINETTGTITVKGKLDRESSAHVNLVVLARDNGVAPRQSNTTVAITVEDVNDNKPKFNQSIYNVTLKESTFKKTVVQQVSASDPDEGANGQFTFNIYGGNADDIFEIDANTGVVKLKNELDYETTPFYNLTIEAKDLGNPQLSGFTFLWVTVTDVDDNAPVFYQEKYSFSVYENVTLGHSIGYVNATDKDADEIHNTVQFTIEAGNLGDVFAIGMLNGSLTVNSFGPGVDRENKAQYELIIGAISQANVSSQKSTVPVTVTILDVNDNPPEFLKDGYSKSVNEDVKNLTKQDDNTLLTVSARDKDEGINSEVAYTIASGNEEGFFMLDNITGVLSKAKMLDREYKDFYNLTIVATDRGFPSLSSNTTVIINIIDMNDNNPVMQVQKHGYVISENSTVGTVLTTVNATDKDLGGNGLIRFSFISGNEDGAFQLDATTGELKTAKQLDFEGKKSYQLTIMAQDQGQPPLSSNDLITVQLTNIDDNKPTFSATKLSLSVGENLSPGSIVGTLNAKDLDGNTIFYYIKAGNEDDAFTLNDTSGILKTRKTLDHEDSPKRILYVLASNVQLNPATLKPRRRKDVNSPTASPEPDVQMVEIEIADQNDNGPKFTEKVYTGGVSGDAKFGSDVLLVTAKDLDTGNTSRISYEILDTRDGKLFSIVQETGQIQAKESYAKLSGTELVIEVMAKDNFGQKPYFNDTATVKIYVLTDDLQSVLISKKEPQYVRLRKEELKSILENITGYTINIDDINYYKEGEKYDFSKTAVLFHAVDPETGKVIDRDTVIKKIDQNYHRYLEFFNEMRIQEVKPQVEPEEEEDFPVVLAVVIALGIILGLLMFIFCCVICNLRKRQNRKLRAATAASYGGANNGVSTGAVTMLPTTNLHTSEGSNPVWVDPFHNWGMKTDEEDTALDHRNPSPFYGGKLPPVTPDSRMFFDAQDLPMDVFKSNITEHDVTEDDDSSSSSSGSWSSGRKSSSSSRSAEPYESSPTGERPYIPENSNKYKVTSI